MLYSFDEATGALQFSHKIELQTEHMLSIFSVYSVFWCKSNHIIASLCFTLAYLIKVALEHLNILEVHYKR